MSFINQTSVKHCNLTVIVFDYIVIKFIFPNIAKFILSEGLGMNNHQRPTAFTF